MRDRDGRGDRQSKTEEIKRVRETGEAENGQGLGDTKRWKQKAERRERGQGEGRRGEREGTHRMERKEEVRLGRVRVRTGPGLRPERRVSGSGEDRPTDEKIILLTEV